VATRGRVLVGHTQSYIDDAMTPPTGAGSRIVFRSALVRL